MKVLATGPCKRVGLIGNNLYAIDQKGKTRAKIKRSNPCGKKKPPGSREAILTK